MSEPVTNVQMEDVLSSIRRLVSEEIGQSGLKPLEKKKPTLQDDVALVLSPAQKIRQDAAEQGEDLWDETAEMAPKAPAPLWWHREFPDEQSAEDALEPAADPVAESTAEAEPDQALNEPIFSTRNPFARVEEPEVAPEPVAETPANDDPLPEFKSRLGGAIADLEAVMPDSGDEWEPEEGDTLDNSALEFNEMPWSGEVEVDDIVIDEFLERETLAAQSEDDVLSEETIEDTTVEEVEPEELSADAPPFEEIEDILDSMPLDGPEISEEEPAAIEDAFDEVSEEIAEDLDDDIPFSFRTGERLFERLNRGPNGKTTEVADDVDAEPVESSYQPDTEILSSGLDADVEESGLVLDEEMLRDMVHDIVRQELQGVLGERITRNVRKLVRREIQRAFSELGQ